MTSTIPSGEGPSTKIPLIERLDSEAILARHLAELVCLDPRLGPVVDACGALAPRRTAQGYAGMAKIICGQQLSVASANAIWSRYEALPGALDPHGFLDIDEAAVRATGFSAGKYRTLRTLAEAVRDGLLDFAHIETLPAEEAIARMTTLKGIGPWTAEIYLLFCAGHPDIFPAGDLALQKAVGEALGHAEKPSAKAVMEIAAAWSPYRGVAALLFWRYFAVSRQKEGIGI